MSEARKTLGIQNAVEFYEKWPVLRHRAEDMADAMEAGSEDAELLSWMIRVIDMVGPQDVSRDPL